MFESINKNKEWVDGESGFILFLISSQNENLLITETLQLRNKKLLFKETIAVASFEFKGMFRAVTSSECFGSYNSKPALFANYIIEVLPVEILPTIFLYTPTR